MRSPIVEAEATLLPAASRPRLLTTWRPVAAPALTTGEPDLTAPPLGVAFEYGPTSAHIGQPFACGFQLLAWPDPLCSRFEAGVKFVLLEGATTVGRGKVVAVSTRAGA
jgi:hypothetical protein